MSNTIVLAYSGGLDTSVIVPWLKENHNLDVICLAADVGQKGGLEGLEAKAIATGAVAYHGADLREAFVEEFIWPCLRAGAIYGRRYLLGTAMARPLIARAQVQVARRLGATAVSHGCTGKGNDQVRFELTYQALAPDLAVVAPWREWDLDSREAAFEYAKARNIPLEGVDQTKLYSRDENLWHISHEGGPLENPAFEPEEEMFQWTVAPEAAPDTAGSVEIGFDAGVPVTVDGQALSPLQIVLLLNEIGARYGVGRADIVEDRLVGMKSRGVYETPGGTLLHMALQDLETITLDRRSAAMRMEMGQRYADMVYEGRWWTPEREALDALFASLMGSVTGTVRLKLFKGNAWPVARWAPRSLYHEDLASFGPAVDFDHADAAGFIRLFGLPIRAGATSSDAHVHGIAGGAASLREARRHAERIVRRPLVKTLQD